MESGTQIERGLFTGSSSSEDDDSERELHFSSFRVQINSLLMKNKKTFTHSLLDWYKTNRRNLPWRNTTDPYEIWISEIMLQQTQVSRVEKDFYEPFLKAFPTVEDLANATWEDVYLVWKGLGYYVRGKNVLKTAKKIMKDFGGKLPRDKQKLESLPGIGEYTARAILAFAWDEQLPAIDTNLSKIISVLWVGENIESVAKELVSYAGSGRDWNNAMMDLSTVLRAGETIDTPLHAFFPTMTRDLFIPERNARGVSKKKKFRIEVGAACIYKDGKYLIQTRPEGKSFVGKWEFPGGKREKGESFRTCVKREIKEELDIEVSVRPHFYEIILPFNKVELLLRFHRCQIQKGEPNPLEGQKIDWVAPTNFDKIEFLDTNGGALEKLKTMRV